MKPWQVIWRLVRFRPLLALAGVISWLLIGLVSVALGLVSRAFFDALSGHAVPTERLLWLAALPLVVQSGRLLVTWVSVPFSVLHRFTLMTLLSQNLLTQVLNRPGAEALPQSPGDAIIRFRDDVGEVAAYATFVYLLSGVAELGTAVVTVTIMLRINAFVTIAATLPLVAVVLVARTAGRRVERYRSQSLAAGSRVTGILGEILGMAGAIKLAGTEEPVTAHVHQLNDLRRTLAVKDSLYNEVLRSIFMHTGTLGTGLVLLLAARAMSAGSFTVGDFALFAAYLGRLAVFTGVVGDLLARYRQVAVSLGRMISLAEGTPVEALVASVPVPLRTAPPEPVHQEPLVRDRLSRLRVRDLAYTHPGSARGIAGITFALERGTFTVVTGRVGSGKTTLLRTVLGLLPKQAGEIAWNGEAVADPAAHFVPPVSSYTPQVPTLFSESLRENILQGIPADRADLPRAIRAAVLEHDLDGFEHGLETPVGPKGAKLSGGQIQRAAAARMFVRTPELLVFDDLSSALDVETENVLWQRLRERPDTTCLAVSHRRAAWLAADQIIVLKDGMIEAQGTLPRLLAESAEFQRLWDAVG